MSEHSSRRDGWALDPQESNKGKLHIPRKSIRLPPPGVLMRGRGTGGKGGGHIPAHACEYENKRGLRVVTGVEESDATTASPFAGGRGRAAAAGRHGVGNGNGKLTHCSSGELTVAGVADPLGTVALTGHSKFPCAAVAAKDQPAHTAVVPPLAPREGSMASVAACAVPVRLPQVTQPRRYTSAWVGYVRTVGRPQAGQYLIYPGGGGCRLAPQGRHRAGAVHVACPPPPRTGGRTAFDVTGDLVEV